ncbi:MAG: archease [Candidatus Omnitrophica bacterium]|nr:archease [Candidatus Omnitrophota bacterium]
MPCPINNLYNLWAVPICDNVKPYEIIEHTADVGLRIYGRELPELFTHAGLGLFGLITDINKIKQEKGDRRRVSIDLKGRSAGDLLLKWLRELLFHFSTKRLVFEKFDYHELSETVLKADAFGLKFDPKRHDQRYEVKAVTYHQFKLKKQKSNLSAEIIFDI